MITIISGTNRKDSRTLQVSRHYHQEISRHDADTALISLEDVPVTGRQPSYLEIEERLLIPAEKFVFVMPEYNGSFPGVLKALMDQSDIRKCWWRKKALLVGLADGRGGNLRGIEHMTNILHYLKMNVYYNKLPLPRINEELDPDGIFLNSFTLRAVSEQSEGFLGY